MIVLLVVLILVAAILLFAATRPDAYGIQRVTTIDSPAERIYPYLIDFRQWPSWSPFEALDPNMNRSYSGATTGTGAIYEWKGNRQAGEGRMTVAEVSPPSHVRIEVDFVKPFLAHNTNQFTLEPQQNGTRVIWSMRGTQPFALKVMSIFVSPDRLLGTHFETGLAKLKAAVERNG